MRHYWYLKLVCGFQWSCSYYRRWFFQCNRIHYKFRIWPSRSFKYSILLLRYKHLQHPHPVHKIFQLIFTKITNKRRQPYLVAKEYKRGSQVLKHSLPHHRFIQRLNQHSTIVYNGQGESNLSLVINTRKSPTAQVSRKRTPTVITRLPPSEAAYRQSPIHILNKLNPQASFTYWYKHSTYLPKCYICLRWILSISTSTLIRITKRTESKPSDWQKLN